MNQNPVKQHTVPKTYLKHFSDNKKTIFHYRKDMGKSRRQNIKSVSIIKDFYTVTNEKGEKLYDMEHLLGKGVEPIYNPAIDKINNGNILIDIERLQLTFFIAAQYIRSPKIKRKILKEISDALTENEKGEFFAPEYLDSFENSYRLDGEIITRERYLEIKNKATLNDLNISEDCYVHHMINLMDSLATEIASENWTYLLSPEKSFFLTSDNPVFNIESLCLSSSEFTGKIFILTKDIALVMGNLEGILKLDLKDTALINKLVINNADKFVFSHNLDLLNKSIRQCYHTKDSHIKS